MLNSFQHLSVSTEEAPKRVTIDVFLFICGSKTLKAVQGDDAELSSC
ncbi:hypothetical protein JM83_0642 [Gillisia sp. Hel_I_86]|nr:hypothetical protein JM83_0642 [Gillisia sp. Hel_I_86]